MNMKNLLLLILCVASSAVYSEDKLTKLVNESLQRTEAELKSEKERLIRIKAGRIAIAPATSPAGSRSNPKNAGSKNAGSKNAGSKNAGSKNAWELKGDQYVFYTGAGKNGPKTKAQMIKSQEENLTEIEDKLRRLKNGEIILPDLHVDNLGVGSLGNLKYPSNVVGYINRYEISAKITQIVDNDSLLARVYGQDVLLKGYPTDNLVDEQQITINGPHHVPKTFKYETVTGADRTILILERVNNDQIKKILSK